MEKNSIDSSNGEIPSIKGLISKKAKSVVLGSWVAGGLLIGASLVAGNHYDATKLTSGSSPISTVVPKRIDVSPDKTVPSSAVVPSSTSVTTQVSSSQTTSTSSGLTLISPSTKPIVIQEKPESESSSSESSGTKSTTSESESSSVSTQSTTTSPSESSSSTSGDSSGSSSSSDN